MLFGIEYSEAADRAMRSFRDQNPRGKHGDHSYTLADWGLDAGEIRERFRPYTNAYDVAVKDKSGPRSVCANSSRGAQSTKIGDDQARSRAGARQSSEGSVR